VETERRVEALREDFQGLRRGSEKVFRAPPVEWIEERLAGMQEVLEKRTERSALLLRALLGKTEVDPTKGEIGRPYYVGRTSLDTLSPGHWRALTNHCRQRQIFSSSRPTASQQR